MKVKVAPNGRTGRGCIKCHTSSLQRRLYRRYCLASGAAAIVNPIEANLYAQ